MILLAVIRIVLQTGPGSVLKWLYMYDEIGVLGRRVSKRLIKSNSAIVVKKG